MRQTFYPHISIATALGLTLSVTNISKSQIISDQTLPTPSQVDLSGDTFIIREGTQRQGNLFHSFQDFSLPTGQIVHFENPATVQNIITRITGNKISNLDGLIKANGTANLFFLNPNGIVFGKNARLDLGGSFIATTASRIKFADGTELGVRPETNPPTLTIAVPIGLQFGDGANSIVNQSRSSSFSLTSPNSFAEGLSIKPNQTFGLVGGDIEIQGGSINALGGRIEIASVDKNSLVSLHPHPQGWYFGYENVVNYGMITLSGGLINASGANGTINLQAREINLKNGGQVVNVKLDSSPTGIITLNASNSVRIDGISVDASSPVTGIFASAITETTGQIGNIVIETKKFILERGAVIAIETFGDGPAGDLIINASESVDIIGVNPFLFQPSFLSSSTVGISREQPNQGNGGHLIINTKRLTLGDGGEIVSVTAGSQGRGGTITVNVSESVHIFGQGKIDNDLISSQITSTSGFEPLNIEGSGQAGDIQINTPKLLVEDSGFISSGSFRSSGAAGNLSIQANAIVLNNNGQLKAESTSGTGGNIFINATDAITLRHNSQISTQAGTSGDGGNININARYIFAVPNQNSDIQANAPQGNGGTITISTENLFGIQPRLESTPLSDITASGGTNFQSGEIIINRPEVDPQSGLVSQDTNIANTDTLITPACSPGGKLASGEFIITGRGGLPTDPFDTANIPQGIPDLEGIPTVQSNVFRGNPSGTRKIESPAIVEAQGWTVNQAGEIVLLAAAEPNPLLFPSPCLR